MILKCLHNVNMSFAIDIPVLDADGCGRAFPQMEMFTPYFYGCTEFSFCVADANGRVAAFSHCDSAQLLEDVLRNTSIEMG